MGDNALNWKSTNPMNQSAQELSAIAQGGGNLKEVAMKQPVASNILFLIT